MKTTYDAVSELKGRISNSWGFNSETDKFLFWDPDGAYYICGDDIHDYTDVDYICTVDEYNDLVSRMKTNFGKFSGVAAAVYVAGAKEPLTKSTKELEVMDKVSCYVCNIGAYPMQQYCGSCGHELLSELIPPQPLTYTQTMADNGELPSVGMECMLSNGITYDKATILFVSDKHVIYLIGKKEWCKYRSDIDCKPLTPPIELIDKGLYLFDVGNKTKLVGEAYFTELGGNVWMITNIRTNTSYQASGCTNIQPLTVEVR